MPRGKQNAEPMLPKGFKPIERLGGFWVGRNRGDTFEGVLLKKRVKHFPKSGKYAARDANVYTFKTKGGDCEITQSGGLGALEQVKKGQHVFIRFLGMKKLAGKQAMREYVVGVK